VLALPPFGFFLVGFISFSILLWLIDGASGDPNHGPFHRLLPAFLIGWVFGLGYFVAGLWWTSNALLVEADEFAWALPLAIFGLPAYLALYYGFAAALARLFWVDGFSRLLSLAAAFGLAEWLRGFVLTGFPWNAIGQALMPFPLMMQSVHVVGSDAMNTLAVVIFAGPALLATGRGARRGAALALVLLGLHLGFGAWRLYVMPHPSLAADARIVRVVQPVIDQAAKIGDRERGRIFEEHLALTSAPPRPGEKRPDYIVWPETSIPFILTSNPDALSRIADILQDGQILIAGAVRSESDGVGHKPRYYNSIYMIDSQGQIIGAADKVHLVPFGEYLPIESLWDRIGLSAVAAMPGGYTAASTHQILTTPDGTRILPLICYEVIFPDEVMEAAAGADVIVNITNDGWFGYTPGPWQHFLQARIRAVETGLGVIRNSNTGISAVINPFGQVVDGVKFQVKGYFDAAIPEKVVPLWYEKTRSANFKLLETLFFLIVFFTRVSFVFNRN
jgi:apolipoprotein N-acyltransferase